jgi:DNA-binding XRE family transcriptional regulator
MNRMVTIERAEYERLKSAEEELADIIAFDKAVVEGGQSIPAEYVKRLIDGDSPLRVYRDIRGLTQVQLSERSGVSRVQISEIETQRRTGSVDTIRKLAAALSLAVDDLI